MDITAKLNYFKTAPRKIRLVADLVRGKKIETALSQLKFSTKKTAPILMKLLKSAMSNAKNNFKIKNIENLYIKKIMVDEGPSLKRFKPVWHGMAHPFKRRTSHITVVLSEQEIKQEANKLKLENKKKNKKNHE